MSIDDFDEDPGFGFEIMLMRVICFLLFLSAIGLWLNTEL